MLENSSNILPFKTFVIIHFESTCDDSIKTWLATKISASKEENGAELLTHFSKNSKNEKVFLHIGASTQRFLRGAEEISLKKKYKNHTIRDFLVEDLNNFENCDNLDEFLTQSECLKIIEHEIKKLKHDNEETKLNENTKINHFDGIVNQFKDLKLIRKVFPMHDKEEITILKKSWYESIRCYTPFKNIPTEKIRNYFGESVAIYFFFFEFYTKALYSFAMFGFITWMLPLSKFTKFMMCSIFNILWNTVFMEIWKRKISELCFKWGTFDAELTDEPRPQFRGVPGKNLITSKPEIVASKNVRQIKKYIVTYPCIVSSVVLAIFLMIAYYKLQDITNYYFDGNNIFHMIMRSLPSIGYSFIVMPLNMVYRLVSISLNDWENHRTQRAYDSNLTTKLFVFYFANSFMCLFYEAFHNKNYDNLCNLLISMLTVNAIVNKLTETFAPYVKKKIKKRILSKKENVKENLEVEKEANVLEEYEGTYSDFVTVFEQYGYLTLFSAVFPWVSLCALINNIMEQRSDAFKYCHINHRPFPNSSSDGIGPWESAFELLGIISVATNMALIALHPEVRDYFKDLTDIEYFAFFVLLEHVLILIKVMIMVVIPNESNDVLLAKQKYKYESLEALKQERIYRSLKLKQA